MGCPVPARNTSPLPSPCRQEPPASRGQQARRPTAFPLSWGCLAEGLHPRYPLLHARPPDLLPPPPSPLLPLLPASAVLQAEPTSQAR